MSHTPTIFANTDGVSHTLTCFEIGCPFTVSGLPVARMSELFLEHLPNPEEASSRGWEVRVSPEGRVALWEPGNEPWYAFSDRGGAFLSDGQVEDWRRFVPLDTADED